MKPLEFLNYKESLLRLEMISKNLRKALDGDNSYEFLPLWCFWIALQGEILTLSLINSDRINSPLAWDPDTRLPSHPSLSADVGSACAYLDEKSERLKIILQSFSGWMKYCEGEIQCACGSGGIKKRGVYYSVHVKHNLRVENDKLCVKQMAGIVSQDRIFLDKHFSWKADEAGFENSVVVYTSKNSIRVGHKVGVEINKIGIESSGEFYDKSKPDSFEFGRQILEIVKTTTFNLGGNSHAKLK